MRIAHIVRRFSRAEWGGTETVVQQTVTEQVRLGHDARIFCTRALQDPARPHPTLNDRIAAFDYWYPYWPMPAADRLALDKKGGSPYAPRLFRAVAAFAPDIIHIHAGGRLACSSVRLAERLGVPSVMSLHGGAALVPKSEMEEMLRPLRHKFPYGSLCDRLGGLRFDPLARVNAVVAISKAEVSRLADLYPGQAVHYLPNGVAEVAPPAPRPPVCPPRRLLCVSRIDYQKNQLALVDLLAENPSCHLTLVGPVTAAWYLDKIVSRVGELGVADRFTLIPGLPPDSPELAAEFARADAFILPSVHEPFGIVALEAMQRGVPLIASAVGGLPDFVRDGENGLLFSPTQPRDLARAFARLADPALRARIVAGGHATVADYAWPCVIGRLMAIYRKAGCAA